ncbi:MAG: hypothetical protein RLZZ553_1470, partial [Verrucomicrobiota bacterium]
QATGARFILGDFFQIARDAQKFLVTLLKYQQVLDDG